MRVRALLCRCQAGVVERMCAVLSDAALTHPRDCALCVLPPRPAVSTDAGGGPTGWLPADWLGPLPALNTSSASTNPCEAMCAPCGAMWALCALCMKNHPFQAQLAARCVPAADGK